jgi:hypothetical protein
VSPFESQRADVSRFDDNTFVRQMKYTVQIRNEPLDTRRGMGDSVRVVPGSGGQSIHGQIHDLTQSDWNELRGVRLWLRHDGRKLSFTLEDSMGGMVDCRFED